MINCPEKTVIKNGLLIKGLCNLGHDILIGSTDSGKSSELHGVFPSIK